MKIKTNQIDSLYTQLNITSTAGQEVELLSIGASLITWIEKSGINIVCSYQFPKDYLEPGMYLGTTVGMNSGRIENASFLLDGKKFAIHGNHPHFLHGGDDSLSFRNFQYEIEKNIDDETVIRFFHRYHTTYLPGVAEVNVRYTIRNGEILLTFDVTSDQLTLCNLTNHSYFNLDGDFTDTIKHHELELPCNQVVLINQDFIGKQIINVKNTFYDFQKLTPVLKRVEGIRLSQDPAFGLDHYFLFEGGKQSRPIRLHSHQTGIELSVTTSYPGVTVYSTNFPSQKPIGLNQTLALSGAICLEAQFAANAINDSRFQAGIVDSIHPYHHFIHYVLGGKEK